MRTPWVDGKAVSCVLFGTGMSLAIKSYGMGPQSLPRVPHSKDRKEPLEVEDTCTNGAQGVKGDTIQISVLN